VLSKSYILAYLLIEENTMFLSELKLWNFRKYGQATNEIDIRNPNLSINFNGGLNLLIGEN